MIIQISTMCVKQNCIEDFQAALPEALEIIRCADGYVAHHLDSSPDDPCRYILTIQWKGREQAVDRFRESGRMKELRELLNGYCSETPKSYYYGDADQAHRKEQLNISSRACISEQKVASVSC